MNMALSKLKNVKTTGHDQMPPKLIKEGGKDLKKFIYEIILKISDHNTGVEILRNMCNS